MVVEHHLPQQLIMASAAAGARICGSARMTYLPESWSPVVVAALRASVTSPPRVAMPAILTVQMVPRALRLAPLGTAEAGRRVALLALRVHPAPILARSASAAMAAATAAAEGADTTEEAVRSIPGVVAAPVTPNMQ